MPTVQDGTRSSCWTRQTPAVGTASDLEIIDVKRVGSRIQLALKHWLRMQRQLELFRFRARWAAKFNEYECVGGPLDGQHKPCAPYSRHYSIGGYYRIDHSDMRLHFHQFEHSPSWKRDAEL